MSQDSIVAKPRSNALPPPPKEVLKKSLSVSSINVEWLAGDGSDRCYYRISSKELDRTLVLMQLSGADAEALKENGYDWVHIANLFDKHELPYPKLIVTLPDYAALITEDYGDQMLEQEIIVHKDHPEKITALYQESFELIKRFLSIKPAKTEHWCRRSFDIDKLGWELRFFLREYVVPVAKFKLSDKEHETFLREATELTKFLSDYSTHFVHRDFHSRNLMVKDGKIAIIDFQDARLGSPAYDLASLVFDNYLPFELEYRIELLNEGIKAISGAVGEKLLREHVGAVILQRQLKAIGTYGFLTVNKKRGDFLPYVPVALDSLTEDVVYDVRWPFLSRELISIMREG